MKPGYWIILLLMAAVVLSPMPAEAGKVILKDGRTLKGKIVARNQVIVVDSRHIDKKLFQFLRDEVEKIEADADTFVIGTTRKVALLSEPGEGNLPLGNMDPGLEVRVLERKDGWAKIQALVFGKMTQGWVSENILVKEVTVLDSDQEDGDFVFIEGPDADFDGDLNDSEEDDADDAEE